MDLHLKGKTAIVTGASQGIGREIVKQLALEGVTVFATARNRDSLESLKKEVVADGGPEPVTFVQDLIDINAPQQITLAAIGAFGKIDILINNAGQSQPVNITGPEAPWLQSMALDFDRPRQLTQELLPHFIMRRRGTILNLASTFELRTVNVSAIAKAALVAWSKQLAGQVGKFGITINCLQPGLINTEISARIFRVTSARNLLKSKFHSVTSENHRTLLQWRSSLFHKRPPILQGQFRLLMAECEGMLFSLR